MSNNPLHRNYDQDTPAPSRATTMITAGVITAVAGWMFAGGFGLGLLVLGGMMALAGLVNYARD